MTGIPVLPLRDVVVFPRMVIPLFVGRKKSIQALELAMDAKDKKILLVAQRDATHDDPSIDQVYKTGTVASILQMLRMSDGAVKLLVEGEERANILKFKDFGNCFVCDLELTEEIEISTSESNALVQTAIAEFEKFVKFNSDVPAESVSSLNKVTEAGPAADMIAAHLNINNEEKQKILEMADPAARIEYVLVKLAEEIEGLKVEKSIRARVKKQMERSQRDYYLNEKLKAIQKELGESEEGTSENDELANRIEKAGMTKEAKVKAESELKKLRMMSPMSAEANVVRNYIDTLLSVPWKARTRVSKDLERAQKILDDDHYGLEKVKERILEYLAVQTRVKKPKAAILCLVGPPGVGKTSLGESIAKATNRKFIRMSLGGVRDEAEIRGHRKTYVGSMPGRIIQNLSKVKSKNPLFMLDEVDKMSMDFRGDPSSALLEVLDPEQNHSFDDHYMEVSFDLSEVMFIATANTLNIPPPLLDRMEVIRISGYTEEEKLEIALRYLIPKQKKYNGLKEGEVHMTNRVIKDIITFYTREAGVRNLERAISKIYRKIVKDLVLNKSLDNIRLTARNIDNYLGVQQYRRNEVQQANKIGQVQGLAWTSFGGELLSIEAVVMPGKGLHASTGKLGDVMKESISAAISVVRSRSRNWGINSAFHQQQDIHVHVPEGATPKDGPSAGIGMCIAIISALTGIAARSDVAMTGEITLRGEVLPVGGLKEKLLAAHRAGIKLVIIPHDNKKDLQDVSEKVLKQIEIHSVKWIDQVVDYALEKVPVPLLEEEIEDSKLTEQEEGRRDSVNPSVIAH
ncbi:MAG: endopeptidase La [Gammaproteobacteria bacterium]|nr:endopeptidase La [Gammaproteobacteria bacterium]MCY4217742.1 endopeptidase La [Gammaproteobacteria bacterium]